MSDPGPSESEEKQVSADGFTAEGEATDRAKREPIFNQTPVGVAWLIGIILVTHIILALLGDPVIETIRAEFGVVPANFFANLNQQKWVAAVIPLFTHQFLHGGTLHIVMNLAMLLQAGPIAELGLSRNRNRNWDGTIRFICLFLGSGICGALTYCWLNPGSDAPTIGASGAISGVFAGFLWAAIALAKPGQAMLRPVLNSAVVFLLINVGLAWVGRTLNVVPIAWESHLGGFIGGLILYPLISRFGQQAR